MENHKAEEELKWELINFLNNDVPINFVIVKAKGLKNKIKEPTEIEIKCVKIMRKALIKAGSVPFVPKDLPLFEIPT